MFGNLLYILQLHVDLFIILYSSKSFAKCLFQLFINAIWTILNIVFSPFKYIIPESKTKQVDNVNFHCFTNNFNGLFEYYDVSIKINVFDIGWIL
jgi:hypothetical protein